MGSILLSGPSYRLRERKLEWDEPTVKEKLVGAILNSQIS